MKGCCFWGNSSDVGETSRLYAESKSSSRSEIRQRCIIIFVFVRTGSFNLLCLFQNFRCFYLPKIGSSLSSMFCVISTVTYTSSRPHFNVDLYVDYVLEISHSGQISGKRDRHTIGCGETEHSTNSWTFLLAPTNDKGNSWNGLTKFNRVLRCAQQNNVHQSSSNKV